MGGVVGIWLYGGPVVGYRVMGEALQVHDRCVTDGCKACQSVTRGFMRRGLGVCRAAAATLTSPAGCGVSAPGREGGAYKLPPDRDILGSSHLGGRVRLVWGRGYGALPP